MDFEAGILEVNRRPREVIGPTVVVNSMRDGEVVAAAALVVGERWIRAEWWLR